MLDQASYPIQPVPELKPLLMVVICSTYITVCYFNLEFGGSEGNIFVLMAALVANFTKFPTLEGTPYAAEIPTAVSFVAVSCETDSKP